MRETALCARRALAVAGAIGLVGAGLICWLSPMIDYAGEVQIGPTVAYIVVAMLMGGSLVWAMRRVGEVQLSRGMLAVLFIVGLGTRLLMFASTPVLEDDWYRYLWDGAVVKEGIDPYAWAPADALGEGEDVGRQRLRELADASVPFPQRVNYPYVKTIYPPVTQGAFWLAATLEPFSLSAWRMILLGVDFLALLVGWWALKVHGRSPLWLIGYWWNPVVILQGFNAGHMDILVVPVVFGLIGVMAVPRPKWSVLLLVVATAIKIWPAMWLPVVLRSQAINWKQGVALAAGVGALGAVVMYPQLRHWADTDQGLSVYASEWHRHAFLFGLLSEGLRGIFQQADEVARWIVAGGVGGAILMVTRRMSPAGRDGVWAMTVSLLVLLLLSPTGYPWYLIWLAPLWCFLPWRGISALMILAPLYTTRFLGGDEHLLYQWLAVPIAFGLPLVLLVWDSLKREPIQGSGDGNA